MAFCDDLKSAAGAWRKICMQFRDKAWAGTYGKMVSHTLKPTTTPISTQIMSNETHCLRGPLRENREGMAKNLRKEDNSIFGLLTHMQWLGADSCSQRTASPHKETTAGTSTATVILHMFFSHFGGKQTYQVASVIT
eukprot:1152418-Pelagomonas_calceolata.AAC.1